MQEIGIGNFLLGLRWKPTNGLYGIFPMIVGSLYVTAGAILIGVPIGRAVRRLYGQVLPDQALPHAKAGRRSFWPASPPWSTAFSA